MRKKIDKKMIKSSVTMSGAFTLLICVFLFLASNEPYLIYDIGKTIKTGDLHPIMFTIGMGFVVLFFILSATLVSIAHYKNNDNEKKTEVKKTPKKRKRVVKKTKTEDDKKSKKDLD